MLVGIETEVIFRGGFASTQSYAMNYLGLVVKGFSCQTLSMGVRSVE
jgi:hypothetical protein